MLNIQLHRFLSCRCINHTIKTREEKTILFGEQNSFVVISGFLNDL